MSRQSAPQLKCPAARLAHPYAALFLASDEARFVAGAEIVVDGGTSVRCD
jgi:NAD(P)-dependent dehydrogenase (short-subunit alcohol dehydrogenase family)